MDDSRTDVTIDLVPLLDVVFQLIMFFMITMSFIQVGQMNHEVLLPVAQSAIPLEQRVQDWVFLNLNQDGKLVGTAEKLDSEARLRQYLQNERRRLEDAAHFDGRDNVNIVIVLRAHKEVPYSRVYEVLDSCTRAGYRSWQLRVKTKPSRS